MEQDNNYIEAITKKDEQKALNAAKRLIETSDAESFNSLADKTQYLFDFIQQNVVKRLLASINESNYKNVFVFSTKYSPELEEFIVSALTKYADEDLTDEVLSLLETGTDDQKAYCAKYFSIITDPVAIEALQAESFSDSEPLATNCAIALKALNDTVSFEKALELLNSQDEFNKLKAARFLASFGDEKAIEPILQSISNSTMPENIAGILLYLKDTNELLEKYEMNLVLECLIAITNGLGEILPLSYVKDFNLYTTFETLINGSQTSKTAMALLKAKQKFELICENDEYTFDETKELKQELKDVFGLINSQNNEFYINLKQLLKKELTENSKSVNTALELIRDMQIEEHTASVKNLCESRNETIIAEAVSTLKALNKINEINKHEVLSKFTNQNLKAIVENLFI